MREIAAQVGGLPIHKTAAARTKIIVVLYLSLSMQVWQIFIIISRVSLLTLECFHHDLLHCIGKHALDFLELMFYYFVHNEKCFTIL